MRSDAAGGTSAPRASARSTCASCSRSSAARRDDAAAAGWDGGRFELWRRSSGGDCASPCVARDAGALVLSWDTRGDRRSAERALEAAFPKGLRARKLGGRGGVRLWSSRGGVIAMSGAGVRTGVAFAPDARTAARVLAAISRR